MEWLFVLLCHVTFWVMFTVTDVIEETQNEDYFIPITVMAMVMTAAAYVTWDWKRHGSQHRKFMPMLLYVLKWLVVGVGIGLPIVWLAGTTDYWIVPQAMGWEHFLNGIEYFVYGTLYVGILPLFILVWNISKFTVGKVKSARNQA